jgi:hypothetical protein
MSEETRVYYAALSALRDFYIDMVKTDTINGKYKGKFWIMENADTLDFLLREGFTPREYNTTVVEMKNK